MRSKTKHSRHHQLLGNSTFGKTHFNRLRKTDILIIKLFPYLFTKEIIESSSNIKKNVSECNGDNEGLSCFVDIGFGDEPITLLQSANYIHNINPNCRIIGCEIDNHKVRNGLKSLQDEKDFYHSIFKYVNFDKINIYKAGFEMNFIKNTNNKKNKLKVKYIRCMNVLRQFYDESKVESIHKLLCGNLDKNGILLEGTSDKYGRFWTVNILNSSSKCIAIVFGTNFKSRSLNGYDPINWQSVLPKNLIHRINSKHIDDDIINKFFNEWKYHYNLNKTIFNKTGNHKQHFVNTIVSFSRDSNLFHICSNISMIKKGFVIWKIEGYGLSTSVIYGTQFPKRKNKVR